ncbi:MAG: ankyrin repeat domain-containing protein [Planctomycetes bacterium]|nr:ankyrin repeat domain-containing protein [Planctomycetota bacterium]
MYFLRAPVGFSIGFSRERGVAVTSGLLTVLLDRGADVNAAKPDGRTALHAAAARGHKEVVALLISHHADVNARTRDGLSPADCARKAGHQDIWRGFSCPGRVSRL